jgi:hypothetical protein
MPAPTKPASGLPMPVDMPDPEATALSLCYMLAKDRTRQLRQAGGDTTQPPHPTKPPRRTQ